MAMASRVFERPSSGALHMIPIAAPLTDEGGPPPSLTAITRQTSLRRGQPLVAFCTPVGKHRSLAASRSSGQCGR